MAKTFLMQSDQVNMRIIKQLATEILAGGVAIVPTDSCYALVCQIGRTSAIDRIRKLRQLDKHHHFTLLCSSLSNLSTYAEVNNSAYRFIKAHTPGPYTFILTATKQVPKKLKHTKRKTIGIRVPDHPVIMALLSELDEGILSVSLSNQADDDEVDSVLTRFKSKVDFCIETDNTSISKQTTVVQYMEHQPALVRQGIGIVDWE